MSNNFHKTAVLNKISIVNESNKAKDCPKKFWGRTRAWISPEACFRFSICLSVIFPGLSNRQMYRKFKKVVLGLLVHATPSNFFRRIHRSEALVRIFFRTAGNYGNYSTLDSHTITVISHAFAYSSRWRRKPWQGLFSLAWLLSFTKSFACLVCRVVGLFTPHEKFITKPPSGHGKTSMFLRNYSVQKRTCFCQKLIIPWNVTVQRWISPYFYNGHSINEMNLKLPMIFFKLKQP